MEKRFTHDSKASGNLPKAQYRIGLTTHMGYASLPFAVIDEALGLLKNRHNQNGIGATPCTSLFPHNNRLETAYQKEISHGIQQGI